MKTTDKKDLVVGQSYWYVSYHDINDKLKFASLYPVFYFKADYLSFDDEGYKFKVHCMVEDYTVTLSGDNNHKHKMNGVIYAEEINAIKRAKILTLKGRRYYVDRIKEFNNVLLEYRLKLNEIERPKRKRRCWRCYGTGKVE